jgi:hypothetical protein
MRPAAAYHQRAQEPCERVSPKEVVSESLYALRISLKQSPGSSIIN